MEKLRILLAGDRDLLSAGLEALINRESDMEVIDQARSKSETLRKARELRPDLIIIDISIPGQSGIETIHEISQKHSEVKVLAISAQEDKYHTLKVLRAGASGCLSKRISAEEFLQAVRTVASGGIYIHPTQIAGLVSQLDRSATQPRRTKSRAEEHKGLSERERDVLRLLALGYSNKEIAARLKIGVKSVDTYKTRFMEKLGLKSRVEMVRYAKQHGLLDEE